MIQTTKILTKTSRISALTRLLILTLLAAIMGIMTGCGGGGSAGTAAGVIPVVPAATTRVAGTASKGLVKNGIVKFYAVVAGVKSSSPLVTDPQIVQTGQDGKFSADIEQSTGPVVIEVSGQYTDEATGATVTIESALPMRAIIADVSSAGSAKRIAVTPLTDLAYDLLADSLLTSQTVIAANARIADIFKMTDITTIEPVNPDPAAMNAALPDQQAYTLVLATLSQMAKTGSGGQAASFAQMTSLLNTFKADLAAPAAGLSSTNISAFSAALVTVIAPPASTTSTAADLSGFSGAAKILSNVGVPTFKLTLTADSPPAGQLIGGITGEITLPAGTSVRTRGDQGTPAEAVLDGIFTPTGSAVPNLIVVSYRPATRILQFALPYNPGFGGGNFATVTVDIALGTTVTAADFTLVPGSVQVIDASGATLNVALKIN